MVIYAVTRKYHDLVQAIKPANILNNAVLIYGMRYGSVEEISFILMSQFQAEKYISLGIIVGHK